MTGRTSTTYDAKGRTTVVVQPTGKRVSYVYDNADRRVYIADPDGGRTTYQHDAAGRLILVNAPGAGRTTLTYDAASRMTARLPAGAVRVSMVYDAAGQLSVQSALEAGGAYANRFTYSYDNASRRIGVLFLDGARATYGYDPAGQLIREQRNGAQSANATFTYDSAGNRTLLIDAGVRTTSTYDVANQQLLDVSPSGRTTYGYDNAGNRTLLDAPASSTYYTWDVLSRLTQANPIAGPVTLSYDGDNRRVRRETPTQTRRFVFDFEKVLQDTDDSGLTEKQYASTEEVYGDLLSAYDGNAPRYFAYDGLGSTDALLAPDGSVPDQWAYRAFGLESHTTGTDDNRFTWVGRQGYYDDREEGLYFLRARYYDPAAARFLSCDPDGFGAGDANLYRYAFNDPVNLTDPSGRRILVRACTWRTMIGRTDLEEYGQSYPGMQLGKELTQAFGFTLADEGWLKFRQEFDLFGRVDRHVGVIDLFDQLPDGAWQTILKKGEEQGEGTLAYALNFQIHRALGEDRVIRIDMWNEPMGLLWLTPEEDDRKSYNKEYPPPLPPPPSFWDRAITSLVVGAGGLYRGAVNVVLTAAEAVADLAQVGLAALAQATGFPELADLVDTARKFIALFAQAATAVSDLVSALFDNPKKLGDNLIKGVQQGLDQFFNPQGLFQRLREAIFAWIFGKLPKITEGLIQKAQKLLSWPLKVADVFAFVVDLAVQVLDLTWDNLLARLKKVLREAGVPVPALEKGLGIFQQIADLFFVNGKLDIAGGVEKLYEQVREAFHLDDLTTELKTQAENWLKDKVATKVAEFVTSLVVPGAGVLKLLYDGLKWVRDNKDTIFELMEKILKWFKKIAEATDAGAVAGLLVGVLTKALPQILSFLGKLVLGDIVDWINRVVGSLGVILWGWIEKAFSALIHKVWSKKDTAASVSCPVGSTPPGAKTPAKCFMALTWSEHCHGGVWEPQRFEMWRLGDRALTRERDGPWHTAPAGERLRAVSLYLENGPEDWVDVALLRPVQWLEELGVVEGGVVYLDLPDVGVVGWARVRAVEPCPPLEGGRGGLVTGLFRHSRAVVYDLVVEGEPEPIGVTELHPFWSMDRQAYVAVSELRMGERLAGMDGRTPRVLSFTQRPQPEPVYNIEVEGDHCYRVGQQGLLVHNASAPSGCCVPPAGYAKSLGTSTSTNVPWFNNGSVVVPDAAEGLITKESVKKGGAEFDTGPTNPVWWKHMTTAYPDGDWARGHLIGNALGGPGEKEWWNMVPLHRRANNPGMWNCERMIRDAANAGHCIKLTVTPIYGNRKVIPLFIKMEAVSLNGDWKLGPVNVPNELAATSPC